MELFLSGLDANPQNKTKAKAKAKAKKPVVKPSAAPAPTAIAAPVVVAAPVVAAPAPAPVFKPSIWEQLGTTVQQALPVVLSSVAAAKNQKRIDKIQEQRLSAGKEPLTPDEIDRYMDATAPVVKVKGGVDNNTSKYLAIGGVAVVGLLFVMNRNKGQSRG